MPTAEVVRIGADLETTTLGAPELGLLESRGLDPSTFTGRVGACTKFVQAWGRPVPCLAFPYHDSKTGKPYAYKLRSLDKKGFACHGAPVNFYGQDRVRLGEPLLIVEGEFDAHACWQAGLNAVSVPNGAPQKVAEGRLDPAEDRKFGYVWSSRELIGQAPKIYIGTDMDAPGDALAEELARRIGREKCWRVRWAEKDANETLKQQGLKGLELAIERAEPWPVHGLHAAAEFSEEVDQLYIAGLPRGESTGYTDVDKILSVQPGMLYVVTGIPGHGKSTWLDSVFVNLASRKSIKTAFASFETPPPLHISRLMSQYLGKPFGEGTRSRIDPSELIQGKQWVGNHFLFMSQDGAEPTVESILDRARAAVMRMGVRCICIDPFNFIQLPPDADGTEAINRMLARFKTFAMQNGVAFFVVAHPMKPQQGQFNQIPTGYSISGSANWFNRPDFGVTVFRHETGRVELKVWKSKWGHLGKIGSAFLSFDQATSTYRDELMHEDVEDPFEEPF